MIFSELHNLVLQLSPSEYNDIMELFEIGDINHKKFLHRVGEISLHETKTFQLISLVRKNADSNLSVVKKLLSSNYILANEMRKKQTEFHLAVTHDDVVGKEIDEMAVETIKALKKVIRSATTEIVIFGFATTWRNNPILKFLKSKLAKHAVHLTLFGDARFFKEFKKIWGQINSDQIAMYKVKHRYEKHSMHAKLALADSNIGLITSANLTFNGLLKNVEIGVLLQGEKVKELKRLVALFLDSERVTRYYE